MSPASRRANFYSPEEGLDRAALGRLQFAKFRALLDQCLPANRFQTARLVAAGISPGDAAAVASLDDFRRFPLTTKADLHADQAAHPPFGTNLSFPLDRYVRFHQTSGTTGVPLRVIDIRESWDWVLRCWGTIYAEAGAAPGDRVFVPFSFGPFLGFWGAFDGAIRQGLMAIPGGGLSSGARLRFLVENPVSILACTPSHALRLIEVAREERIDLRRTGVRALIVAGEPGGSVPILRRRIEEGWGARVFDHWGMTEVGPLGFEEAQTPCELLLLETECIAEVIDPVSELPSAAGETGELVVTHLGRTACPLIRYRTGDLVKSAGDPSSGGPSPGGRQFMRLKGGILGRVDDMFQVRGNNVYPSAIDAVLRSIPQLAEYRAEVTRRVGASADLRLVVEPASSTEAAGLVAAVCQSVQEALSFRPDVELAPPGSLPRYELKATRFVYHPEKPE